MGTGDISRAMIENTKETAIDVEAVSYTHLSGTVLDKTGESVIGASVVVKGTTNGTITDFDGKL